MKTKLPVLDFSAVRLTPLKGRHSKVNIADFAKPLSKGQSIAEFKNGLPNILAAKDLKLAAQAISDAVKNDKTVMLAMGGHPIKVGLGPVMVDLLEKGIFTSFSSNGSVMVHDTEVALIGSTSEEVAAGLGQGDFGVTADTGWLINQAAKKATETSKGLGRCLGELLLEANPPHVQSSVLATCAKLDVPFTVHTALGSDVYNIHPDCRGEELGKASMDDFKTFCRLTATLGHGGVFINLGSAVVMPEVFLKAITLCRNLGHMVEELTTINMDFLKQYRSTVNVVERPTRPSGHGYSLIGHHEIMFPLIMSLVLEEL